MLIQRNLRIGVCTKNIKLNVLLNISLPKQLRLLSLSPLTLLVSIDYSVVICNIGWEGVASNVKLRGMAIVVRILWFAWCFEQFLAYNLVHVCMLVKGTNSLSVKLCKIYPVKYSFEAKRVPTQGEQILAIRKINARYKNCKHIPRIMLRKCHSAAVSHLSGTKSFLKKE